MLSVTLFLVAIISILAELGNGIDRSLFADGLSIYITTRNQKAAPRALKEVANKLDAWAMEKELAFSNCKTINVIFRKKNHIKKLNCTLQLKYPVIGDDPRHQMNWEEHIDIVVAKAESIKHY